MTQEVVLIAGFFECRGCRSTREIVERLPQLRWKIQERPDKGKIAFAVMSGVKETGEIHVLAILENAAAPAHEHLEGGLYGERIITISGALADVADDGSKIILLPGSILDHRGGSIHTPRPSGPLGDAFWFGYYHQPRGSRMVS